MTDSDAFPGKFTRERFIAGIFQKIRRIRHPSLTVRGRHYVYTLNGTGKVIHIDNQKPSFETHNVIDYQRVDNVKVFHCIICGQLKPLIKEGQKYCGINCNMKAYRERQKKSQWKICAFCGEGFIPNRTDQKCCKPAHRKALHRQLKALDGQS